MKEKGEEKAYLVGDHVDELEHRRTADTAERVEHSLDGAQR